MQLTGAQKPCKVCAEQKALAGPLTTQCSCRVVGNDKTTEDSRVSKTCIIPDERILVMQISWACRANQPRPQKSKSCQAADCRWPFILFIPRVTSPLSHPLNFRPLGCSHIIGCLINAMLTKWQRQRQTCPCQCHLEVSTNILTHLMLSASCELRHVECCLQLPGFRS